MNSSTAMALAKAGWEQRQCIDSFGRCVSWYRSITPQKTGALLLWLQGSGYHSLFQLRNGQVRGGYQNILRSVSHSCGFRVIAVEKPGIHLFGTPLHEKGTAFNASADFRREHTLERWVQAIEAVLTDAIQEEADHLKLGIAGHSEGALVAAVLAARNSNISHIGLLGCGGMTRIAECYLAELSGASADQPEGVDVSSDESLRYGAEDLVRQIMNSPRDFERLAWGHPFVMWSTFGVVRVGEELSKTAAKIFLAHGERDDRVPLASFAALAGHLWAINKRPKIIIAPHADHGFRSESEPGIEGITRILTQFVEWMESHPGTQEDAMRLS